MQVQLHFFAQLKEIANTASISLDITPGTLVENLIAHLDAQYNDLAVALKDPSVMVSINQQIAQWDSPLSDGDEVGFLPPVSGG